MKNVPMAVTNKPMVVTNMPMVVINTPMVVTHMPMVVTNKPVAQMYARVSVKEYNLNRSVSGDTTCSRVVQYMKCARWPTTNRCLATCTRLLLLQTECMHSCVSMCVRVTCMHIHVSQGYVYAYPCESELRACVSM